MRLGELNKGDKFYYNNKTYTLTTDPTEHYVVLVRPDGEGGLPDWLNQNTEVEVDGRLDT